MPGKAILIAGYPGSGKSTYGKKLKITIDAVEYVDDYHKNAVNSNPAFDHGRKYHEMIEGLQQGETWIASDITWCKPQIRRTVEDALRVIVPDIMIEWHFIESDEDVCRERVSARGRESAKDELQKIDKLSHEYHIPPNSKVISVSCVPFGTISPVRPPRSHRL